MKYSRFYIWTTGLLVAGAAAAVHGGLLWRLRDRPAQHLACLAGVLMAAGGGAGLAGGEGPVGLAVAAAGALWVAAGWFALLPPPVLAMATGGVAVLTGAASHKSFPERGDFPLSDTVILPSARVGLVTHK